MKRLMLILSFLVICASAENTQPQISEAAKTKLEFDYLVNLPILMRAVFDNSKNQDLNLTKEQIIAIRNHKINVMDNIEPVMKEAHMLSNELKYEVLYGKIDKEEAFKTAARIAKLKEQVLDMKITCIFFIRETLTKEQFQKLLELDQKSTYLKNPYN